MECCIPAVIPGFHNYKQLKLVTVLMCLLWYFYEKEMTKGPCYSTIKIGSHQPPPTHTHTHLELVQILLENVQSLLALYGGWGGGGGAGGKVGLVSRHLVGMDFTYFKNILIHL